MGKKSERNSGDESSESSLSEDESKQKGSTSQIFSSGYKIVSKSSDDSDDDDIPCSQKSTSIFSQKSLQSKRTDAGISKQPHASKEATSKEKIRHSSKESTQQEDTRRRKHTAGNEMQDIHQSSGENFKSPNPRKRRESVTFSLPSGSPARPELSNKRNMNFGNPILENDYFTPDLSDVDQMVPSNQHALNANTSRSQGDSLYQSPVAKNKKQSVGKSSETPMKMDSSRKSRKRSLANELENCERPGNAPRKKKTKRPSTEESQVDECVPSTSSKMKAVKVVNKNSRQEKKPEIVSNKAAVLKEGTSGRKTASKNIKNEKKAVATKNKTAEPKAGTSRSKASYKEEHGHLLQLNGSCKSSEEASGESLKEQKFEDTQPDWDKCIGLEDIDGKELFLIRFPSTLDVDELEGMCTVVDGVSSHTSQSGKRLVAMSTTGPLMAHNLTVMLPNRRQILPHNLGFDGEVWIHEQR